MSFKPLGKRVAISLESMDSVTASGLYVVQHDEISQIGRVLAIGPGVEDVAVDDRIVIGKYAGHVVEVEGRPLHVLNEEDILGVLQ